MRLRLSDYVIAGEMINRRRNSTHGWLALRGLGHVLHVELTGDPAPELVGKRFRFEIPEDRPAADPPPPPLDLDKIATQQIGPTGAMSVVQANGQTRVSLEWFSQNGQVLVEVNEPELEWIEDDEEDARRQKEAEAAEKLARGEDPDEPESPLSIGLEGLPSDDEDDPYGLFPPELDQELAAEADPEAEMSTGEAAESTGPRDWSDVIPGIDPETKRMYEEWDEVTYGTQDVPLTEIFDPPVKLYTAQQLETLDDATVTAALKDLLKRLALLGVALSMCEHCTAKRAYHYLTEEILPQYGVHPRLPQIGWVQHYDTSEDCPECEARFDREWAEQHPEDPPADEEA
jgi:hypothetical protein